MSHRPFAIMSSSSTIIECIAKMLQLSYADASESIIWQTVHEFVTLYCGTYEQTNDILEFSFLWFSQFTSLQDLRQAIQKSSLDIWSNEVFKDVSMHWNTLVQHTMDQSRYDSKDVTFACVRCNSTRVTVTTAQIRSADEGMTEFRNCRDCGFVSRINS